MPVWQDGETDKENSYQELDPYYTMTTMLFAHQSGGRSHVNWINMYSRRNRSIHVFGAHWTHLFCT